jgi:hypothetical protein
MYESLSIITLGSLRESVTMGLAIVGDRGPQNVEILTDVSTLSPRGNWVRSQETRPIKPYHQPWVKHGDISGQKWRTTALGQATPRPSEPIVIASVGDVCYAFTCPFCAQSVRNRYHNEQI